MAKHLTALILFFLFANNSAISQNRLKQLDSLFSSLQAKGNFNGNVLIAEKGKPIYKKSFGIANEVTGEKLNGNSIFELASVSKQFTAMGIVILEQRGKLSFEDSIGKYIPELKFYKNVTIRNLLNHTSGLPDYMDLLDSLFDKSKIATNKDVVEVFARTHASLLFEPGTEYEYSNTGYVLLAEIIERISHTSFKDFLKTNIFNPLGMKHSFVYNRRLHPKSKENYALGYVRDSLGNPVLPDSTEEYKYVTWLDGISGDGTVNSTTGDLLIWDRALKNNKLVSKKVMQLIFSPAILKNGKKTHYGFGWQLDSSMVYGKVASHTGGWPGYITSIELDLTNEKTIIILQNITSEETVIPSDEIRKILYRIPISPFIHLDLSQIKQYEGRYTLEDGSIIKFIIKNDKLYWKYSDDIELELQPISATNFIVKDYHPEVEIEFFRENGTVKGCLLKQPERKIKKKAEKILK